MVWTNDQMQYLRDNVGKMTHLQISSIVGHSEASVRDKCYRTGLVNRSNYWTEEEIKKLTELYENSNKNKTCINLKNAESMFGKIKSNISRKARELGLGTDKHRTKNIKPNKMKRIFKSEAKYSTAEERNIATKEGLIAWHKTHDHPRGMLGKHHSKEFSEKMSSRVKREWENMTPDKLEVRRLNAASTRIANGTLNPNANCSNPYSRTKSGKRTDLNNVFFRSSWEANMARYYNYVGIRWMFEPKTFIFSDIKRGCVSYTPDFYLPDENRWVEVKGWMDEKSATKLKRFEKFYPIEYSRLELITRKEYREFEKFGRIIPGWE